MPDKNGPEQAPQGQSRAQSAGSSRPHASSERDFWRDCEPPRYCGPVPPYWDPYCGPPPYYRRHHHHHRRHHRWPMPGSEFFKAMMQFAASTAGFRERWWEGMADAARYARSDYMCGDPCYDPCYDPCAPHPSYCDPCAPPPPYCDPCAPSWCYCDPCAPQYDCCEASDLVDIKGLSETLKASTEEKLKSLADDVDRAEGAAKEEKAKEYSKAKAKAEAASDAIIHAVKLARVAEAMRQKQWSRGSQSRHRY
jgi:hypothetical protein